MPKYKYLIIGGGMTAAAAVDGIREIDPAGSIGMLSQETDVPYNRPPLTKALWKGEPIEKVWRGTEKKQVEFHLGRTAQRVNLDLKQVTDDWQTEYAFDKLLLATGGRPRRLPFADDRIIYYRTLADYRALRALTKNNKRFAVIGGGFIGSEIAAALAMNQRGVVMVFPGDGICNRVFPREVSQFVTEYYREKGVEVCPGESIKGVRGSDDEEVVLQAASGREFRVSAVIAGIGIEPNVELARAAGLKVENGIVVNELLQTAHHDVYAAGDAAAFYSASLGTTMRVEHEDNANTMGRMGGRNMAGSSEAYRHLPFFYSDLFDLGYEAVGELDARLETFADWKTPYREGVIYYLKAGRVRGVLLWNVWGQVDAARGLINEARAFRGEDLKGRLPKPG